MEQQYELENNQNESQNLHANDQEEIRLNENIIDYTEKEDNEGCEFIPSTELNELKKTIQPCTVRRISMEEL